MNSKEAMIWIEATVDYFKILGHLTTDENHETFEPRSANRVLLKYESTVHQPVHRELIG
jgi:hypothetical protein